MCTMSLYTVRCAHVIVQPATPLHLPVSGPESSHHHMSGCKPAGECKQMVLILSVWIDSNHNDATCLILCGSFVIAPNYHLAIHCNKWQQFDLHKKRWYLQINEMSSQSQWKVPRLSIRALICILPLFPFLNVQAAMVIPEDDIYLQIMEIYKQPSSQSQWTRCLVSSGSCLCHYFLDGRQTLLRGNDGYPKSY